MRAISNQNHRLFCRLIQEFRENEAIQVNSLSEMESELCSIFQSYQQRIADLQHLIVTYDARKRAIRNKLKQMLRERSKANV